MRPRGFIAIIVLVLAIGFAISRTRSTPETTTTHRVDAIATGAAAPSVRPSDSGPNSGIVTPSSATAPNLGVQLSDGEARVEPLREANGVVNPHGFHLRSGQPIQVDLPSGVAADVWDCFVATHVVGPAHLGQVCEMTVRAT